MASLCVLCDLPFAFFAINFVRVNALAAKRNEQSPLGGTKT